MIVNKVTTGFVVQSYDTEKKRFVIQEFIAGDSTWTTRSGEDLETNKIPTFDDGLDEPTLTFDMIQPK